MRRPRYYHSSAVLLSSLHLVGGKARDDLALAVEGDDVDSTEHIDPSGPDVWTLDERLEANVFRGCAVKVYREKLYEQPVYKVSKMYGYAIYF